MNRAFTFGMACLVTALTFTDGRTIRRCLHNRRVADVSTWSSYRSATGITTCVSVVAKCWSATRTKSQKRTPASIVVCVACYISCSCALSTWLIPKTLLRKKILTHVLNNIDLHAALALMWPDIEVRRLILLSQCMRRMVSCRLYVRVSLAAYETFTLFE
jgi:hypothetical protein